MHKNHVPTKSELAWFSKSAESLYKSLETMKQEVSSAQEAHKMLVSSYQRQLSELESIQSQIDSSESVIEIKQQYCTAMERELVKMAGIRHPVRQLPAEVLQCIFESACDLSTLEHLENRIITAIRLSHVCCRWRSIAISTPRMWSTFCLPLEDSETQISPFWNLVLSRIKHAPAHIVLWDVGIAGFKPKLTTYNLQKLGIIDRLEIHLVSAAFFNQFATPSPLSGVHANTLAVETTSTEDDDDELELPDDFEWDLGKFVTCFPTVTSLELRERCGLRFSPSAGLARITSLALTSMLNVDIFLILSNLIQLEALEVRGGTLRQPMAGREPSSSLRKLVISKCNSDSSWLSQLSLPQLMTFVYDAEDSAEHCFSFVQNNQSITTLWVLGSCDINATFAHTAPRILSYGTGDGFAHLYKRKSPKAEGIFPYLKELALDTMMEDLTLVEFEGIVKGRCIPLTHPQSKLAPSASPLHSLIIIRKEDGDMPEPWRNSDLFQSATRHITSNFNWKGEERLVLSWV